ncbi:MAG: leucine-rich repeat protein [bacterium]
MAFLIPAMAEDGGTYTLMNIPYADFYRSEGAADVGLDAVSSATFNKPRTMGLSDGSYHVNADGSDITGIIYPVYVQNLADLETLGGREITDASSVDITVTNRGKTTTTTYTGRDALYEAPSYSYYILSEAPALYKTLSVADGAASFTAIKGRDTAVDATATFKRDLRHCDIAIAVNGLPLAEDENVSAVEVFCEDGSVYGLRHIANLWRKVEIGFNLDSDVCRALADKRITRIRYITQSGRYSFNTDLLMLVNFDTLDHVLTLPKGIARIEEEAFAGIAASAIDIPAADVEQEIGSRAFAGIPENSYVQIPSSVTAIAENAFDDTPITIFCAKDSAAYVFLSGKANILWRQSY